MGIRLVGDGAWGAHDECGGRAARRPHACRHRRREAGRGQLGPDLPERSGRAGPRAARALRRRALRRDHRLRPALARLRLVAAQPRGPRRPRPARPARRPPGRRPRRGPCRAPARGRPPAAAQHAGEHRGRGRARHDRHRRGRDDPLARGGAQPAPRGRLGRAGAGDALVGRRDRHERDGHRAGRRRARADPLRRAPGAHRPLLDLRRRPRARPRHRHAARRDRHQRPLHTAHPAMVQLVAATAQLAENQLRVRLAIADEQLRIRNMPHLGEPARPAGRAGDTDRADPGRRAVHRLAGAGADRAGCGPGPARRRAGDGRRAAGRGLSCCTRRNGPPPRPAAGRCRCGSSATTRPCCSTAHPSRSPSGPPSCSPRSRCTPTG